MIHGVTPRATEPDSDQTTRMRLYRSPGLEGRRLRKKRKLHIKDKSLQSATRKRSSGEWFIFCLNVTKRIYLFTKSKKECLRKTVEYKLTI